MSSFIVSNYKKVHKSLTVIFGLILSILSFLELYQGTVTNVLQQVIPDDKFPLVTGILSLAIIIGRYIRQPSVSTPPSVDYRTPDEKTES